MRRSRWMAFIVIASFFIAVPGYGLELKIATLSPEGSAWMQKMQDGLPMKFKSLQEIDRIRKTMGPMLMEGFEKSGFVTFGLAEGGFAYLMSNNPIRTTEDLRTHKVWIPGNDLITAAVLKRVGINPIPLPIADVLTSLQTGLVDTVPAPPIAAILLQ